ncbi:MAG: hypothetical protein PHP74_00285, partial [Candidatus Gracilibacteria bacterium]|nr:hypothetical protein [Candidatus Gracilibacteria bacterium]
MSSKKSIKFLLQGVASVCLVMAMGISYVAFGADTTLTTSVTAGELTVDIVDGAGATVPTPGVTMSGATYSNSGTSESTGTLGAADQKIFISNLTATDTWTLSIAATTTDVWTDGGSNTFDFNDGASGEDENGVTDADSVGGQLTVNPSAGTLTGVASTSVDNISKGSSTAFAEGVTDSITLLTAGEGAAAPGEWTFTGISLSQIIPPSQPIADYTLDLVITVS